MRPRDRSRLRIASLLIVALLPGLGAASPSAASAAVYWGEESSVGAANLDGTEPVFGYPYGGGLGGDARICGLAVHGSSLYWADRSGGAIGRMELRNARNGTALMDPWHEGVAIDQSMIAGLTQPCGIAVDDSHLYWASSGGLAIGRANLDGSGVEPSLIRGAWAPCGVAVDAGHVYWANQMGDSIGRANLDGSEADQSFITGADRPCGVAVDAGHIYWANESATGSIGRAGLNGGEVDQSFVANTPWACGVAVDQTHVYWSATFTNTHVGRASLDGSDVTRDLIPNAYGVSCGVALDARIFKPPPPPPSRTFFLGRVTRSRRSALVLLPVKVPDPGGAVTVLTRGLSWRLLQPQPPVREGAYLIWQLKVWPGKSGRAARRIRERLRRTGHARAWLTVSFQEPAHSPVFEFRDLTLISPST